KPGDVEATKLKASAQQAQTYQTATTAFKLGDYSTALRQSQQYQGTDRFDRLSGQITQEQSQLETMQKALSDGNYADILAASLPAKPAFNTIKGAATEENQVLKQAQQKLAAGDFSYIATLEQQSYGSKPPFVAVLNDARQAQEALKNQQKSNTAPVTVSVTPP